MPKSNKPPKASIQMWTGSDSGPSILHTIYKSKLPKHPFLSISNSKGTEQKTHLIPLIAFIATWEKSQCTILVFFLHSSELCADGGHCGAGKWMQTMCLVKFEIDLGSSTYSSCHSTNCAFSNLHISLSNGDRSRPLWPRKCQVQKLLAVGDGFQPFGEHDDHNGQRQGFRSWIKSKTECLVCQNSVRGWKDIGIDKMDQDEMRRELKHNEDQ